MSDEEKIEDLKEQVEYQDLWRKEYLSRIDKAIEYIKEKGRLKYKPDELINILQGDSSNETTI